MWDYATLRPLPLPLPKITLKPLLLMETDAVLVAWLARVRCAAFWFRILSNLLYEGRILRVAAMEAMECGGTWIMKLQECLKSIGWCGVGAEEVWGLASVDIKIKLETCTTRLIEDEWTWKLSTAATNRKGY